MAQYNEAENDKPRAYRVDDDDNLEEKDLRHVMLFGSEEKTGDEPNMESKGAGGQNFGKDSKTPSGDDKNNPSQNAGYSNEYFRRTEPLEEHPEYNNFKDPNQLGQSNYTEATGAVPNGQSDEENAAPAKDSEENKDEQQLQYQEGTADRNQEANIPGPNELPDQQKVGE
ncbi:hypothetical protein FFF34_004480 [Inquilinus sp. KBS0705]|nr:hypothetical protein FFF34_004480 [Inquilinus sp. KBS0705]